MGTNLLRCTVFPTVFRFGRCSRRTSTATRRPRHRTRGPTHAGGQGRLHPPGRPDRRRRENPYMITYENNLYGHCETIYLYDHRTRGTASRSSRWRSTRRWRDRAVQRPARRVRADHPEDNEPARVRLQRVAEEVVRRVRREPRLDTASTRRERPRLLEDDPAKIEKLHELQERFGGKQQ